MIYNKKAAGLLALAAILFVVACDDGQTDTDKQGSSSNAVSEALASQIDAAEESSQTEESADGVMTVDEVLADLAAKQIEDTGLAEADAKVTGEIEQTEQAETIQGDPNVDIDLSVMNADMIYATVYQFMIDPDSYIGKTIKIRGQYFASWYEETQQYYQYCFSADAAACCQQGLEFVLAGDYTYPDDYPEDYTEIEIVGCFTTYEELGQIYCKLADATMTVF